MASQPLPGVEVLVVDDNRVVRTILQMALEHVGYTYLEADGGQAALERLRTHPCGMVVLCDWHMPGMDGEALLGAVAADAVLATRHAYILMTGTAAGILPTSLANTLRQLDAQVLHKPFHMDVLLSALAQAAARLHETA